MSPRRRRLLLPLLAAVVAGTAAMPAVAAGPATTETSVVAKLAPGVPSKKHPKAITVDFGMHWQFGDEGSRATLQHLQMLFPRGTVYNGAKYPRCTAEMLNASGPRGCPKGSQVGKGRALADADTAPTTADITVFNGGPSQIIFYTTMTNPAIVQTPVVGTIRKLASGPWGYQLTTDIPGKLQVIAGVPIFMTDLRIRVGSKSLLAATKTPTAFQLTTTLSPARG